MKIIISPAKKMKVNSEVFDIKGLPVFMEETRYLIEEIRKLSYEEVKKLWNCNDKLAVLNYERFRLMEPDTALTPALLAYEGLQYQHLAPVVLEHTEWDYLQTHLCILSGLYGIVRPLDGVIPYRLEMQAKLITKKGRNLYDFWEHKLFEELADHTDTIINLASKEYSRCIEAYLTEDITFITCVFGEYKNGTVIEKGTIAKMARGEMVRFMATEQINTPEQLKEFTGLNFRYRQDLSHAARFVFINN